MLKKKMIKQIVLQPCGVSAIENYDKTIKSPIYLKDIQKHIDNELFKKLHKMYPSGEMYIWGVKNNNYKKWNKIKKNDIALFSWNKKIQLSSSITTTVKNPKLAKALWNDGEFEYIYFIEDNKNKNLGIPVTEINKQRLTQKGTIYKKNFIQTFDIIDCNTSTKILKSIPKL